MIVAIVAPVRANAARPAVTVEIESIDNLISDVTTASKTLGQKTMEPAMMRGAIGEALNAPGLVGIDTTKPIQIHVFLPKVKADDPAFTPDKLMPLSAFVLPLSDNGQAFSSAVKAGSPFQRRRAVFIISRSRPPVEKNRRKGSTSQPLASGLSRANSLAQQRQRWPA
jgi:hypothetical protein